MVPPARLIAGVIVLALAYFACANFGFQLTFHGRPVSAFWLPNAILLSAFLLTPTRTWWLLLLAVFPVHLLSELRSGVPLAMTLSWFLSNSAEALIGATLIRRLGGHGFALDRFTHVGLFVGCVVITGTAVSTLLDAGFVSLNHWGRHSFWQVTQIRFFSNALAAATVVPFVLSWAHVDLAAIKRLAPTRVLEAGLLVVGLIGVTIYVFGVQQAGSTSTPALLYAPLPLLLWATVRFGVRGQSAALLFIVFVSMWSTGHGRGPFSTTSAAENALTIQLFFVAFAITLLALAAMLDERQRAQAAAHQKGEQLQLALDAAHMSPWSFAIVDGDELPSQQVAGLPAPTLTAFVGEKGTIHPRDATEVASAIEQSARNERPLRSEFRVIQHDGSVRWMLGRGKVILDQNGLPARMLGVTADITERKAAEALSAGENHILAMIATGAPLADILNALVLFFESETSGPIGSILLLDDDGVHARHAAAPNLPAAYTKAIDGFAIGPMCGSCGSAMYQRKRVVVTDIASDPLWQTHRELALAHDLRACWSTPIMYQEQRVLGSFAIYYREPRAPGPNEIRLIEIATQLAAIAIERHRTDSEIHEQRTALAHLGRVATLGELSGTLAHELAQPLTAILSNAQAAQRLLQQKTPDLALLQEIVTSIVASDRRANDVIQRMRLMLTKGQAQLAPLNLADVVFDTMRIARADLFARQVAVTTRVSTELPLVLGDRVQLQQVIMNLIINACDAMSSTAPADRHLAIAARHARDDGEIELTITDAGSGIAEALMKRIFDPFYSSKEHGLGLGLAICRSIMRAHQGQLTAANNAGSGATFTLTLPAQPMDAGSSAVQQVSSY